MNSIIIRPAIASEASLLAPLVLLAMHDLIHQFTQSIDTDLATEMMQQLIQATGNQYSYQNIWVAQNEGSIAGMLIVYDGALLTTLRSPVVTAIQQYFGTTFAPEDETSAGEMYIDCVAVHPSYQGKGIGSRLLLFAIEEYVIKQNKPLGLLVDDDNPAARKLYERIGFKQMASKRLTGKQMYHFQYLPDGH